MKTCGGCAVLHHTRCAIPLSMRLSCHSAVRRVMGCAQRRVYARAAGCVASSWLSPGGSAVATECVARRMYVVAPTGVLHQSWSKNSMRPWMCVNEKCRAVNKAVAATCAQCGTAKPALRGWKCVKCEAVNYSGVRRCKGCGAAASESAGYWMCAVCKENNRVDELEDNSRCGFCGYDMAPHSLSEEVVLQRAQERSAALRQKQEAFDEITAQAAEQQWGDELADVGRLPPALRAPLAGVQLPVQAIAPFASTPAATRHSRLAHKPAAAVTDQLPPGPPGFDWQCREPSCGHINPGDEEVCLECKRHITPCEWECPCCAALNHLTRSRCFNCQQPIPVSWTCEQCGERTSIYDKVCRACGAQRPPVEPKLAKEVKATVADDPAGAARRSGALDWKCEGCGGVNFARRTDCYRCGAARGTAKGHAASQARPRGEWAASEQEEDTRGHGHGRATSNNWTCPRCQASNFRTRTTCWKCRYVAEGNQYLANASGPHFAKEGFQDRGDSTPAEGQMSSWAKGDKWVCARCYTSNYRSRTECHRCGAARTAVVTPRRATVRKPVKL